LIIETTERKEKIHTKLTKFYKMIYGEDGRRGQHRKHNFLYHSRRKFPFNFRPWKLFRVGLAPARLPIMIAMRYVHFSD